MKEIIKKEELISLDNEIDFVSVKFEGFDNYALLNVSPEKFVDICRKSQVTTIFYRYMVYNKEKFLIADELLKERTMSVQEYNFCKEWAEKRNMRINSFDFSRPTELTLVAMLNALLIMVKLENEWMDENIGLGVEDLSKFQETHMEEINGFWDEDGEGKSPFDKLKNFLWKDKEFRSCTNKEKRRVYIKAFLKKQENQKYLLLFRQERDKGMQEHRLILLIDEIYWEYKKRCSKLKISLGEALPDNEK